LKPLSVDFALASAVVTLCANLLAQPAEGGEASRMGFTRSRYRRPMDFSRRIQGMPLALAARVSASTCALAGQRQRQPPAKDLLALPVERTDRRVHAPDDTRGGSSGDNRSGRANDPPNVNDEKKAGPWLTVTDYYRVVLPVR